jgi:hypothetical protein
MSEKNLTVTLNFERRCTTEDIGGNSDITSESGSIEVSLGSTLPIANFRDIKVEEICSEYIRLGGNKEQILHKGGYVTYSWAEDGYEDHEGVVWSTDYHFLKLFWE